MLVSTKKMLEKAEKEHYAVAQININNLEWTFSTAVLFNDIRNITHDITSNL